MKVSGYIAGAFVVVALAGQAFAQQAEQQVDENAPPTSAAIQSAPSPVPAEQATEMPKRLGSPRPAPPPAQLMQRPPPRVHVAVVSPQDSRFSKRLRTGTDGQGVPRRRGGAMANDVGDTLQGRGNQLLPQSSLGMPMQ